MSAEVLKQLNLGLGRLVFFVFLAFCIFAMANDEGFAVALGFFGVVGATLAVASWKKPQPSGTSGLRTRKSAAEPEYVKNLMFFRWVCLIGGGLFAGMFDLWLVWAFAIAAFILMTEYASRKFHSEDKESWEIVFHNETDGYSSGDGDGDGGGD